MFLVNDENMRLCLCICHKIKANEAGRKTSVQNIYKINCLCFNLQKYIFKCLFKIYTFKLSPTNPG